MADRTLVAYRREAGYDLHYAHDGVAPDALSPATPFGGPATRDVSRVRERLDPLGIDLGSPDERPAVEPVPLATGLPWASVVADLDYRAYDRCLRIGPEWTAERYLVCYFGLGDRGGAERDPAGDGALLPVTEREEAYAFGWFEGVKSAVADAARCGLVDEAGARSYMAGRVRAFAGDRTAHVGL